MLQDKSSKYNVRTRATCDFCKQKHSPTQETCNIEVMGIKGNDLVGASKITLQNVIDEMYYKRELALCVVVKN